MHQAACRNGRTRRVVVTGIGAVTPIGMGVAGLWSGVLSGCSAIRRISRFDASTFSSQIAAEVTCYDPNEWLDTKSQRRLDRCSQFAVTAAKMALVDSEMSLEKLDRSRIGVCIGSALGGAAFAEEQHRRYLEAGDHAVEPHLALQMFVGAGTCNTAIALGLTGYSTSNADSCASGTVAIGNAYRAIQRGEADAIFAGAAEAPLAPLCYGAFARIRALSTRNNDPTRACRPFDTDRDGFVMGEGAAVLFLEEREHALGRGARIYAELVGYALTNDAHDMTVPRADAESAARCITMTLTDGGLSPGDVDYINAHGSSTRLNDATETKAIKLALGEHAYRTPISGTKAMHGHALGATGAIEAGICCLSIEQGYIPPTINLDTPDPECDLDYVPGVGRRQTLNVVLSNSFGFGGINACLAFQRPED